MKSYILLFKTATIIVLLFLIFESVNSQKNIYNNNFPFQEDWQQGSFTFNGWLFQPSQGNWIIDPATGNPAPSAAFTWAPAVANYSYSLLSPVLNAIPYTCADFWLDFDLKLIDNFSTGTEKIDVDLNYNNNWVNLIEYSNTGTTDWSQHHLAIDSVKGKPFQIRFRAFGVSSSGIQAWYIDNIHAYAVLRGPSNFKGETPWGTLTTYLEWDPPICGPLFPDSQWIQWTSGEHVTNCLVYGSHHVEYAARWTPDQINYLQYGTIKKINFYAYTEGTATYRVRIWEGPNAANLVVDQPVPALTNNAWNMVTLNTPHLINVATELWVGVDEDAYDGGIGCDGGPVFDGYGNMFNNGTGWIAESNLNVNWNIEAYVEFPDPDTTGAHLLGYNIFRTPDNESSPFYQLNSSILTVRNYVDVHSFAYPWSFWHYFVTAVYEDPDSAGSVLGQGSSDTILVGMTEGIPGLKTGKIMVFPNPTTGIVHLQSEEAINKAVLYDCLGNEIPITYEKNDRDIALNLSECRNGLYLLKITVAKGTFVTRLSLLH